MSEIEKSIVVVVGSSSASGPAFRVALGEHYRVLTAQSDVEAQLLLEEYREQAVRVLEGPFDADRIRACVQELLGDKAKTGAEAGAPTVAAAPAIPLQTLQPDLMAGPLQTALDRFFPEGDPALKAAVTALYNDIGQQFNWLRALAPTPRPVTPRSTAAIASIEPDFIAALREGFRGLEENLAALQYGIQTRGADFIVGEEGFRQEDFVVILEDAIRAFMGSFDQLSKGALDTASPEYRSLGAFHGDHAKGCIIRLLHCPPETEFDMRADLMRALEFYTLNPGELEAMVDEVMSHKQRRETSTQGTEDLADYLTESLMLRQLDYCREPDQWREKMFIFIKSVLTHYRNSLAGQVMPLFARIEPHQRRPGDDPKGNRTFDVDTDGGRLGVIHYLLQILQRLLRASERMIHIKAHLRIKE